MGFDTVRQMRIQQMLSQHNVGAFIAWRPDELVLMSGYYPQWGASLCLYPCEGQPILFNPILEPDDRLPAGVDVRSYPWGKAADPWTTLLEGAVFGRLWSPYGLPSPSKNKTWEREQRYTFP